MPTNKSYQQSFEKFKNQLRSVIEQKANRIANEVSSETVKLFVKRAHKRLDNFAMGEGAKSAGLVSSLKNYITYEEARWTPSRSTIQKIDSYVRIKKDPEGLIMFLEFGTGIAGSYNEHPEAKKFGWSYVVSPQKYKRPIKAIPTLKYNGYGWFFKDRGTYIGNSDYEDVTFNYTQSKLVSGYKNPRSGKWVEPYWRNTSTRKPKTVSNAVFTQGIKPVRFVYDTKIEIKDMFKSCRSIEQFRKNKRTLEKI